jgi:hypothetical protein
MPAATPAAEATFLKKMSCKYPAAPFNIIVQTLLQGLHLLWWCFFHARAVYKIESKLENTKSAKSVLD